ncbi:MAG: hypothetical protein ISR55_11065 [Bacteroidetes bacterium]|nr:hypothetical protein [Bacteroidota bacterium]
MKKLFLGVTVLLFASSWVWIACQKETNLTTNTVKMDYFANEIGGNTIANLISECGNAHNSGLSYLLGHITDIAELSDEERTKTCAFLLQEHFKNTIFECTDEEISDLANCLDLSIDADVLNDPNVVWEKIRPNLENTLSSREIDMMNKADAIFDLDFTGKSKVNICETILYETRALIEDYNNTNWSKDEGDLIGGFLTIIEGSARFWKDDSYLGPTENQAPVIIIPADAAGYIAGWGAEVLDDIQKKKLDASGQKRRITKGLYWACIASGIKYFKYLGL